MSENEKMMYEEIPTVAELNKVEGFDPSKHMREMTNDSGEKGLYLDVQWRKLWFRLKYPTGKIKKTVVKITEETAIIEARVYLDRNDPDESYISSGMAQRWRNPDDKIKNQYVESAETAATGRALMDGGFGIQFCDVGGEKDPSVVDAPMPVKDQPETQKSAGTTSQSKNPSSAATPKTNKKQENTSEKSEDKKTEKETVTPSNPENSSSAEQPKDNVQTSVKDEDKAPDKKYDASTPVEEICKLMTLDEAKNYIVNVGFNRGKTLGKIAIDNPSNLVWYIDKYNGTDNILRASAIMLVSTATTKQAS